MFAIKRSLIAISLLIVVSLAIPSAAFLPLVAAPVAVAGASEGALLGLGALVTLGVVSKVTADKIREKHFTPPRVDDAGEAKSLFEKGSAIFGRVNGQSSNKDTARCESKSKPAEGECKPEDRDSPWTCCKPFMEKLRSRNFFKYGGEMQSVGDNAFMVRYWDVHGDPHECCFEWDKLHGRFEVFTQSDHTVIKHRGERACALEENLKEDLCNANHPEKAEALLTKHTSHRHVPRSGCYKDLLGKVPK